jgi:tetraacyldisaccharide 4'-kinase
MQNLFKRLADDREPASAFERALQAVLAATAPVYATLPWTNRLLHESGIRPRARLEAAVLSVGNVTLGGTGKTPFVLWLTRWLESEGRKPAILTRGYGREDEDALTVAHDGRKLRATTNEAGDEPVLLARSLARVPIIACSDRHRAGRLALKRFAVDTCVLDDGLQHVQLDRQGEIILIDATQRLDRLRLFPRGTLREPLGVLSRAHLIVLTRCDEDAGSRRLARAITRQHPTIPVVRTRLVPADLLDPTTGEITPAAALSGHRLLVACGVGNPDSVREAVEGLGAHVLGTRNMADHARYTAKHVTEWKKARLKRGAEFVLVTEKDWVKIEELDVDVDGIRVLRSEIQFLDEADERLAQRVLRSRLRARGTRGYLARS